MKKIIFLHGFFASGECEPAVALREAYKDKDVEVITPDVPLHPEDALSFLRQLCDSEKPDLIIGNSCGSLYAQMLAQEKDIPALMSNPYLLMTEFLEPRLGDHEYKSPRKDGNQKLPITKELIEEYRVLQEKQFESYKPEFANKVWAIFGDKDEIAHFEPLYLRYYSTSHHFPGGHTPTAADINEWYLPLIDQMLDAYAKKEGMSDYDKYCQMMAQQQEEDMDDVCFEEMPEGMFVRGH